MKRLFDLVVTIVLAPFWGAAVLLTAVVAAAVQGFPVFFTQERAGKGGRPFRILKFRTMRTGAGTDAERLTRFGAFLRKTSLDEVPELLNVLKGDMSLVGPRPLPTRYLPRYTPEQNRRHEVLPGITGWAQVNGRNSLDWETKFRYDVEYVDGRSFAFDLKILFMTAAQVLCPRHISHEGEVTMSEFKPNVRSIALAATLLPSVLMAGGYEIGEAIGETSFWTSDPVLFVKKHADAGFSFTSDSREGADSRQDGGVTCFGVPVYESKVAFGEAGGIERIELILYSAGGTETMREFVGADGKRFRRRERIDKTMTRAEFGETLSAVRARLTRSGTKAPTAVKQATKSQNTRQFSQSWPKTDLPTRAILTWSYEQEGKKTETFSPGFIRLTVDGPARLASGKASSRGKAKTDEASGAKKIADNVVRDPRGDVFIDNLPMVDQGQKGYCSVATAERVLRYYGVEIDEHELAQAAGTKAEGGTSTLAMKQSVEAIGRKYKLGTVVCYGDFEKSSGERIAGLADEVRAYNKMAKKLKKDPILEDVYVRHEGNTTWYYPDKVDEAMDAEVLKEMKVNGMQKARYTKFMKDVHDQVSKGIPLFWGVTLGTYPEPGLLQAKGGHMRLIVGFNDKKKEVLYSDSWGAGHELKRMPADWAWTISHCLMYLKPLSK